VVSALDPSHLVGFLFDERTEPVVADFTNLRSFASSEFSLAMSISRPLDRRMDAHIS
jgi:hypothetical protein